MQLDFTRFWHQCSRQIHPHHRFDDGVFQGFTRDVFDILNFVAAVERVVQHAVQLSGTYPFTQLVGGGFVRIRLGVNHILVQLQPEVGQWMWRVVGVSDDFFPHDALLLIIEFHFDVVVYFLLPIRLSRCARGRAVSIGGRELCPHLPEFALIGVLLRKNSGTRQEQHESANLVYPSHF